MSYLTANGLTSSGVIAALESKYLLNERGLLLKRLSRQRNVNKWKLFALIWRFSVPALIPQTNWHRNGFKKLAVRDNEIKNRSTAENTRCASEMAWSGYGQESQTKASGAERDGEGEVRNTQRTRTREIRMGNQMRLVFLFACSSHLLFVNLEFVWRVERPSASAI